MMNHDIEMYMLRERILELGIDLDTISAEDWHDLLALRAIVAWSLIAVRLAEEAHL
jgi:hypothetical protein